jgi:glycine/D-amino acid oxidase-like deaminating enzyme
MALAKGAQQGGASIMEGVTVTGIHQKNGRVSGVATDQGDVQCEIVVNCVGMWGRELGKLAGVNIPLHAAEHYYLITEPLEGMHKNLPTLRDPGGYTYYREEAGALLAGFFEPNAVPWGMKGIPPDAEFIRLQEDWDHLEVVLDAMAYRMPVVKNIGIHTLFNGPESFTPDNAYHLGEAPELKNFYVAAGFNSIGIQSSGGAGKVLAEMP